MGFVALAAARGAPEPDERPRARSAPSDSVQIHPRPRARCPPAPRRAKTDRLAHRRPPRSCLPSLDPYALATSCR